MGHSKAKARKNRRAAAKIAKAKLEAPPKQVGLFVTKELESAIEHCRAQVERIAKEHRARNRKFRDFEFDLENDTFTCLHGYTEQVDVQDRRDIRRVTELFDQPYFFPENGAANSNSIRQGDLGDCYFLSALATVSNVPGLIEKICVARDEQVGVYGFIFYQDHGWISVIIDDLLMTKTPKWESLTPGQQMIYHNDKVQYNATARKGGNVLLYAKAGSQNETWVPLIEKAYAKLYTNFAHLVGGQTNHAIEDLTGGISVVYMAKDILDVDRFWKEELLLTNRDRMFACAFDDLDAPEGDWEAPSVQGLYGGHAYSILRAAECNGKRFLVVRNPWGEGEWKGAWSDGSKEWTKEWIQYLPQLQHTFGEDGQFVMEYNDFLQVFTEITRTFLFDDSWVASSSWVQVPLPDEPRAPMYGPLSFRVEIPTKSKTILVLARLNDQAFRSIHKETAMNLTFALVKLGELEPIQVVYEARPYCFRSLSLEVELEAGTYIVYVMLERVSFVKEVVSEDESQTINPSSKVISRILAAKVARQSISTNWTTAFRDQFTAKSLEQAIAEDLLEVVAAEDGATDEAPNGTADGAANGGSHNDDDDSETVDEASEEDPLLPQVKRAPSTKSLKAPSLSGDTVLGEVNPAEVAKAEQQSSAAIPLITTILRLFIMGFLNILALFGLTLMRSFSTAELVHVPIVVSSLAPEPVQEPQAEEGEDEVQDDQDGQDVAVGDEDGDGGCYVAQEDWRSLLMDSGTTVILGLRVYTQSTEPATVTGRLKGVN